MSGGRKAAGRRPALLGVLLTGAVILGFCVCFFLLEQGYQTFYSSAYPTDYSELVERYAEQNELPLSLVYAVIRTESSFRPAATSHVGARGLMQLMPDAFDWVHMRREGEDDITFEDMYDPERNIDYGTYMLSLLLAEFGSVENALCAYHAGWGNVKKWLADERYSQNGADLTDIPIKETKNYLHKVAEARQAYRRSTDMNRPLPLQQRRNPDDRQNEGTIACRCAYDGPKTRRHPAFR